VTSSEIFGDELVFILNKALPESISIFEVIPVESGHAQFDASSRTYDFLVHRTKDPFLADRSMLLTLEKLDLSIMIEATGLLKGQKDFRSFCIKPEKHDSTTCLLKSAELAHDEQRGYIRFRFSADRFLRGMVRILVQHILDLGQGHISLAETEERLRKPMNISNIRQAYPQGLYLSKVEYAFLDRPIMSPLPFLT